MIRNEGSDSYKFETYGEKIAIEKRIFPNGTSKYKIKSIDGRVISSTKEELEYITDHFNIQVCNPACILTQETSRKFLSSSNPKAKYTIFLNATCLSNMKTKILTTIEKQSESENALKSKKEDLKEYKSYVYSLKSKIEVYDQLNAISERILHLKHQIKWAAYKIDYKVI